MKGQEVREENTYSENSGSFLDVHGGRVSFARGRLLSSRRGGKGSSKRFGRFQCLMSVQAQVFNSPMRHEERLWHWSKRSSRRMSFHVKEVKEFRELR